MPFIKKHKRLSRYINQFFKDKEGEELWTNALGRRFGERVCVGFEYPFLIKDWEKFKPTAKEKEDLYNEFWREGEGYWLKKEAEKEFG